MKKAVNMRLKWRSEISARLLDEIEIRGVGPYFVDKFCERQVFLAADHLEDLRQVEFGIMGMIIKRKLREFGFGRPELVEYLRMVEDCFQVPLCLN